MMRCFLLGIFIVSCATARVASPLDLTALRDRYIEPNVRWYRQTEADFYLPFILEPTTSTTGYESSDSRLGPFHAMTYGVKFAQRLAGRGNGAGSELSVRAEYYRQTFNERAAVPAGLQGLDLYPGLEAILVQVGWRF